MGGRQLVSTCVKDMSARLLLYLLEAATAKVETSEAARQAATSTRVTLHSGPAGDMCWASSSSRTSCR